MRQGIFGWAIYGYAILDKKASEASMNIFDKYPLPWTISDVLDQSKAYGFYDANGKRVVFYEKIEENLKLINACASPTKSQKLFVIREVNGLYLYQVKSGGAMWGSLKQGARFFNRRCDATQCIEKNKLEGEIYVEQLGS